MQHHYTDTPDASPAGAWWARGSVIPVCVWMFDRHQSMLTVTTATFTASHRVRDGARPGALPRRRDILPLLALQISRRRVRSP